MKILMLNYEFPPLGGGAGNATYYLLKEFSEFPTLEIDLITSSIDKFKIQKFSKNINIHFLDINKKGNLHYQSNKDLITYYLKALKYSKNLLKNKSYNLCHAFFGIPCGYIAMKLGLPYIVSLRGSDVPFYNKRFYVLDKVIFQRLSGKIWRKARKVIANSEGLRNLALKSSPNQEISIIPNGVDINQFKPLKNKKQNKEIILISTGRLIERKGYEYLIKAISNNDKLELNLIGDGNLRNYLEELAKKLNSNVKFLGSQPHDKISSYLQKADIFILPSLNEGMSNSILEAMACGLPIIITYTGGAKELIKTNGFIVKKSSVESIREALKSYTTNSNLVKQHSKMSRKLVEKLSWGKVAEKYKGEYDELA